MIDIEYLKSLLEIFEESSVNDLKIEKDGTAIRLTKNPKGEGAATYHYMTPPPPPAPHHAPPPPPGHEPPKSSPAPSAPAEGPDDGEAPASESATGEIVISPIVGTFYRAPSPDSDPFVKVGDTVKKGDVLCIVEAMKLMNEIESEYDGTVTAIYVEDAQPVEYGSSLFCIE